MDVTSESIRQAAEVLAGVAHVTPVMTCAQLDARSSARVFVKCEHLQRTGSFKFRGAYHAASVVQASGETKPVVTLSSGNHGQGLALAAKLLGLSAHVVVPQPASPVKLAAMEAQGARLYVTDNRAQAEQVLGELSAGGAMIPLHAFNDPGVIAGQGTIMLELARQVPALDVLLAPLGGGGLLSGLCVAARQVNPSLRLYGCEPRGAAEAADSLRLNRIVPMPLPQTMADGLRTSLGSRTLPILREHLTDIFVVDEREIVEAMQFAYERMKQVIEPSSAVALAPLLRAESVLKGRRVGVVMTGGNVDLTSLWSSLAPPVY